MPVWWTKRSLDWSSGVMNPKPLSSLNHLTVPVAIVFLRLVCVLRTLRLPKSKSYERWHWVSRAKRPTVMWTTLAVTRVRRWGRCRLLPRGALPLGCAYTVLGGLPGALKLAHPSHARRSLTVHPRAVQVTALATIAGLGAELVDVRVVHHRRKADLRASDGRSRGFDRWPRVPRLGAGRFGGLRARG